MLSVIRTADLSGCRNLLLTGSQNSLRRVDANWLAGLEHARFPEIADCLPPHSTILPRHPRSNPIYHARSLLRAPAPAGLCKHLSHCHYCNGCLPFHIKDSRISFHKHVTRILFPITHTREEHLLTLKTPSLAILTLNFF
jgi:hypothetical protein